MIIRERVYAARLAEKVAKNPSLARELGIETTIRKEESFLVHHDNIINDKRAISSTEAYE